MREFFRGWKRKIGVVTLLMACLFLAGWLRSLNNQETTAFSIHDKLRCQVLSQDGIVTVRMIGSEFPVRDSCGSLDLVIILRPYLDTGEIRQHVVPLDRSYFNRNPLLLSFPGYGFVATNFKHETLGIQVSIWNIPYWSIVLPLTLASAWLLSKRPLVKAKAHP